MQKCLRFTCGSDGAINGEVPLCVTLPHRVRVLLNQLFRALLLVHLACQNLLQLMTYLEAMRKSNNSATKVGNPCENTIPVDQAFSGEACWLRQAACGWYF